MSHPLIIFDCDGVLVDSEPLANRVFTEALAGIGLDLSYEQACRTFIGLSMARCVEMIEERIDRPVPPRFVEELQARTFEAFERGLQPVEGVVEVVEGLTSPFCVASSGELEKMRFTLGHTGLLPHFQGKMFSATQVRRGKPYPDLFLYAAAEMQASPGSCVVVEDSDPGVRAARAAGMTAIGFAGRGNAEALTRAGAHHVLKTMSGLPALLAETPGTRR